jgi:catalase
VIAPVGGVLKAGRQSVTVERTLLTARSIEFDAVIVAADTTPSADIKLILLLQEAYRHCKAIAAWGDATALLEAAGIPSDGPGVTVAETAGKRFSDALITALGLHRAWDRAPGVMASAVAPAATTTR